MQFAPWRMVLKSFLLTSCGWHSLFQLQHSMKSNAAVLVLEVGTRPSAQVHGLLPSRFLALRIWNLDNIDHEVWPQKQPTKRCQGLSSFVVRLEDSLCQNSRNDCCDINLTGYHRMLIVLVFQKRAGSRPQMCFQIFQVRKKLRKNNANSISFNSVVTATWKQTSAGVKRAATFWRAIRGVAVKGSTTGWDIWLITLFRLYIFLNLRL